MFEHPLRLFSPDCSFAIQICLSCTDTPTSAPEEPQIVCQKPYPQYSLIMNYTEA